MCLLVTRAAPDFAAQAVMPDGSFAEIKLSSYRGKYVLLFFYPLDFTFVCPSEIIAFDKALPQFEQKDCEILGVSVDSHFTHWAWRNTPREQGGIKLTFIVRDVHSTLERITAMGLPLLQRPWGGTDAVDPEGNIFALSARP